MSASNGQLPILEVDRLRKTFVLGRRVLGIGRREQLDALDDVSLQLGQGRTLAIVGESGCGKSTLARVLLRFEQPTSGVVLHRGDDIFTADRTRSRALRRQIQPVLQDPYGSLNPRRTVMDTVAEPWDAFPEIRPPRRRHAVAELLARVSLSDALLDRYPSSLSGGQRQRVNIARALAAQPDILVLDEPLSALDVSMQAQVINLLSGLQEEYGVSYLFITHDLSLVPFLAHDIAVMYMGGIVETGSVDEVFGYANHPYTQALLSAAPTLSTDGPERIVLHGDVPNPVEPPSGCRFRTRCWRAQADCTTTEPELELRGHAHLSACLHPETRMTGMPNAHS